MSAQAGGGNRNLIIVIVVVVVLLCCCCIGIGVAWSLYGPQLMQQFVPTPAAAPATQLLLGLIA
jgi:hypothetical protein